MKIDYSSGVALEAIKADAIVLIVSESEVEQGGLFAQWNDRIAVLGKTGLFGGKLNQTYVLPLENQYDFPIIILCGCGDGLLTTDQLRILAANIARAALRLKAEKIVFQLPGEITLLTEEKAVVTIAYALTEGLRLGAYRRRHYKQEQTSYMGLDSVTFNVEQQTDEAESEDWVNGIQRGQAFAEATNLARDLTNIPGNLLTPSDLAMAAIEVAERYGMPAEVLDEREIEQKGMGGLTAVGKGSVNPPRMIVIRYQGREQWDHVIGLVGKGITFDTGGISLKRAPGMEEMISDMGGAAAVLGVMEALGRLRPQINVVMVIPSAENMPSANAFKPGDIITTLSGRTIEVLNTDAEGRVVLGDALTYAREWGAERIIDLATLTGAVLTTLGDIATGAVTNDEAFMQELMAASRDSGENIWQLPVYPEFREMIKSEVADIRNAAGRYGGASTAGLFIGEFAEGLPWIHLDIAGTAFLSKERGVNPKGATGVMVRTLLEWLLGQNEEE
ncbi:leucyl aminopeptidase [Paenibacillus monticola]|uniref:Probable cytosol aminopeptidase n=1 Tax=Paenibacillus monticola TaxID=2666075 RepID=A0A7X2H1Q9_9BACL|nr:leucyl aminopeptidase [Paenibacillus monticola]MRN51947.1 leucyl aminopeptidase [Paenibacillus monticola]